MSSAQPKEHGGPDKTPPVASTCGPHVTTVHPVLVSGGNIHNVAGTCTSPSVIHQQNLAARQQQLIGGMMVVPSLSPPRVLSSGSPSHSVLHQPLLHRQDVSELQILRAQSPQQQNSPVLSSTIQHQLSGTSPTAVASATGNTIHHLGQNPMSRCGRTSPTPPVTNPFQQQLFMSGNHQDQQSLQQQQLLQGVVFQLSSQIRQHQMGSTAQIQHRRVSGSRTTGQTSPGSTSESVSPHGKPMRTSPLQSPERVRKRLKVETKPAPNPEIGVKRKLICDYKLREMARIKENYKENLTELFFLQNGGNIMEYFTWKKRPTAQLVHFLKSGTLGSDDEDDSEEKSINNEVKVLTTSGGTAPLATPVAIATSLPVSVAAAQQDQSKRPGGRHGMIFGHIQPSAATHSSQMPGGIPLSTASATTTAGSSCSTDGITSVNSTTTTTTVCSSVVTNTITTTTSVMSTSNILPKMTDASSGNTRTTNSISSSAIKSLKSPGQLIGRQSISSVYENAVGSQEAIVERAKQEAQVLQRVAELRREGLWSSRRLPKVQEPARNKAHWDYLLEEMQWLAADFAQERKWKKAGARKIARMITRYFQELQQKEVKAEKEEGMKLKRIANNMAKMVKEFWSNIEKVVQYKQQSRLEEKRKRALDLHLSFIVDQTEKYSSWLTEGLNTTGINTPSIAGSVCSTGHSGHDDRDFEPNESGVDDEETIDLAEAEDPDDDGSKAEIDALQRESELPLEDLLKTLPREVLEKPASLDPSDQDSGGEGDDEAEESIKDEDEYRCEGDSGDDEHTVAEQEKHEKTDHKQELDDLRNEGDMTIEELQKKYAAAYDSDFEAQFSQTSTDSDEEEEEEEESDEEEEMEDDVVENEDVGIDFLSKDLGNEEPISIPSKLAAPGTPNKEITDIAATAESIQPTGYTLETTEVKTKVPFLLKHTLREYQHVGLDWLATLHERKLNGILADEMGLGKTIQTIAVLAHLATEWGVWGPHLIVVPTSVMLNWELELKKWCPAFKILTYYGNQKERKLKRQGWTKTNAFHVCITSYKLVIQDHQAFRRKKWKYLILDEAQNIKNFKSQRWQTLLNFSSQRRLLLTGTPLQNSLMELWSLMHFLMPHVFQSHKEFKEWFANPLSGMIEGSWEYNEQIIRRLHKVLRPFLLRRLKQDVEKQMPKKYEHVVMCHLSRRQRFLYDEFMAQSKTKETLASGHFMSVINILMQLRKVCNHPNLFDPRPIQSPFQMEGLTYHTPSLVLAALQKDPIESIDLNEWHAGVAQAEISMSTFTAHRIQKLQTPRKLIEEIDSQPDPEPRLCPVATCKPFVFRSYTPAPQTSGRCSPFVPIQQRSTSPIPSKQATLSCGPAAVSTSVVTSTAGTTSGGTASETETKTTHSTPALLSMAASQSRALTKVSGLAPQLPTAVSQSPGSNPTSSATQQVLTSHPITVQIHQTQQGTRLMIPSGSLSQLPAGFIQIVQTSTGQQLIAATSQPLQQSNANIVNGPTITVATATTTTTVTSLTRPVATVNLPISSSVATNGKPVVKVSPMTNSNCETTISTKTVPSSIQVVKPSPVVGTSKFTSDVNSHKKMLAKQEEIEKQSIFYLPSLAEKKKHMRREKLQRLSNYNKTRCDISPIYGQDLHRIVDVCSEMPNKSSVQDCPWTRLGFVHCCRVTSCSNPCHPSVFWNQTNILRGMVHTPQQYMDELKEILDRFVFACPSVTAPRIRIHASHPAPSWLQEQRHREFVLKKELAPRAVCLHNISARMTVQFPELRLIEYDCGKLQTLDLLLARLKAGSHRVLIFTQMTRMLDVLEQFLSYHGHRYLRLDGTTKVEQRQILMDRFNMDKRIFCFILSTRSGGIGVNLTGADTVVFYDSDWNPTMDAQAQDRCHRIGQTRDVHIYRLVSEMTVEENILKKANQKRLLGNVAIEGGNFTAAFFKQQTISELFEEPSGLQELAKEQETKEVKAKVEREVSPVVTLTRSKRLSERREITKESKDPEEKSAITEDQLEQALCAAEEETDMQSVSVVKAEQKAELAEFDENIPWDEREAELKKERDEELSKVEQELAMLEKELTLVERYAVVYMEGQMAPEATEELEKAEEEVTIAKEEWELSRLQALKEEDELRAELEEDEMLFTYARDDAYSQAYICDESGEHMPTWAPPTPPQDDNDVYIDCSMYFMYEPNVMLESQLPAIYVKKEQKRIRIDPAVAVARKHKVRKEEHHRVPRSLFDRPQSLLRKERDLKLMKLKQFAKPLKPQLLQSRPHDTADVTHSDWLVHEDWALLQALQMLQELPLTLATDSPAIIPNWDLVADMVNACSRTCRSIKQCKNRYENVIVPREEGKILYDVNPRKQKKSKGIYKVGTKNNRPMRTSQLYLQDNSNAITSQYSLRFDSSKSISAKRTPTIRPTLANPTLKNPKHAAVLAENGINYEQPLTPTQVAAIRAERIAKEKQKNQEAAQQQIATGQRTTTTQAAVTTTPTAAVVAPALAGTTTVQTVVAGQQMAIIPGTQLVSSVPGAPTTVVVTAAGLQKATAGSAVAAVSLARTLGPTGSIVVNPASANPFAAINKKIAGQTLVGTLAQTLTTTANSSTAQAVRAVAARSGTTHMTVQEIAAVVNQSPARVGAHNTAQVITTTTLTPAQIIAAQKGGTVITAGAVPQGQLATKTLTPQQLQILRLRQQQLRRLTAVQAAASQHSQTVTGVGQAAGGQKSVSVTTPLITSIAQSQVSAARLQLAKQPGIKGSTITRSLSETEMAILLKRQQLQQRTLSGATLVSQGATPVQQVQVSQGHMARFTTAQILTGTQVQQVHAGQSASVVSSGSQPVATLVKTVTTQGSATVPSVTIPVTAVNLGLGISVNVPTQKALPAKNIVTQQMRQIQLQQLQRTKHIQVAAAQQKVATLGQLQQVKGPGGTTPLIIPPQQQTATLPKVMVQQIHQIVKQQPTMQQPTIQQIIASVPPSQTTTATVIATQLVSQAQPTVQTVTKMSVPSGFASSAVTQAIRLTTPMTANTITGTTSHGITLTTGGLVTGTPTVTLTPSQTTLVKNLQDVMTPQKSLTGTIQQVKTVQQATAAVRQIQGAAGVTLAQIPSTHSVIPAVQVQQLTSPGPTVAVTTTPKIIQQQAPQQQPSTVIQQQLVQPGTTSAQMVQSSPGVQQAIQMVQPSPGVQQAVQKVVQEAQAQAQHRVAVTVGGTTITHHAPVTVTQSPVVSGTQAQTIQQLPTSVAVAVTGQAPILGQAPITGQVTLPGQAPMPGQAQILGQASLAGQDPKNDKNSPYSMRLRNQRT